MDDSSVRYRSTDRPCDTPVNPFRKSLHTQRIIEIPHSIASIVCAAASVRAVALGAALLRWPLRDTLVAFLVSARRSSRAYAAAITAWVHAIDETSFLDSKNSISLGIDCFALVGSRAAGVRVVAIDAAALAKPTELLHPGQSSASIVRALSWFNRRTSWLACGSDTSGEVLCVNADGRAEAMPSIASTVADVSFMILCQG